MPNSITLFGENLGKTKNSNISYSSVKHPRVHLLLPLQQEERQQTARQHPKQMEELRRCHQNIPRAHQIIIGNNRPIIRMMQKTIARNHRARPLIGLLPRMLMRPIVKVLIGMLVRIVVHIAKVDFELIVACLDQRMHDLDPFGLVALHLLRPARLDAAAMRIRPVAQGRRPAEELTVPRRRRREYDARHEP